jgi:hypothetical protein
MGQRGVVRIGVASCAGTALAFSVVAMSSCLDLAGLGQPLQQQQDGQTTPETRSPDVGDDGMDAGTDATQALGVQALDCIHDANQTVGMGELAQCFCQNDVCKDACCDAATEGKCVVCLGDSDWGCMKLQCPSVCSSGDASCLVQTCFTIESACGHF